MKTISKRFEELDVCGKVTLKSKLREIAYPDLNSMCPPPEKVNTKGAQKKPMTKHQRSTKYDPSYWEYVDALHSVQNSNSLVKHSASSSDQAIPRMTVSMLDQFHPFIHDFIEKIVNVKVDDNCGYRAIAALLEVKPQDPRCRIQCPDILPENTGVAVQCKIKVKCRSEAAGSTMSDTMS
ncbi:hypothetical protein GmHk_20G057811 [Glycine max]|nr:hypothetical protein GmHk_20G057811 [Glycine max]